MRLVEQAVNGRPAVKLDGLRHLADTVAQKVGDALQAVFDGVLVTNTGKKIGKKGKTLDDATITGKINWYYRNVVVLK